MDMRKDLVAASATPLVLAILAEGDSYGYAIIKRVAELSGGHLLDRRHALSRAAPA
jgi:PadR family transcriptional regulator PadR